MSDKNDNNEKSGTKPESEQPFTDSLEAHNKRKGSTKESLLDAIADFHKREADSRSKGRRAKRTIIHARRQT